MYNWSHILVQCVLSGRSARTPGRALVPATLAAGQLGKGDKMNMPRMPAFTAEASLRRSAKQHAVAVVLADLPKDRDTVVHPALRVFCGMKECCIVVGERHYCWFK